MGNEITKKYELPEEHNATAGLGQLWKIFPGVKMTKDGQKKEVSVWIMTKESLAKRDPIPITDKNVVEQVFQIMKKDLLTMKDMSHGGIVKVIEVAEEGRKGIVFVTEHIVCSLADILSRFDQVPGRYNWHTRYLEPNATITEVEISRGILNIAAGIQYLHTVKKKLHLNISPESIVLTPAGQWKLCGFGFALGIQSDEFRIALPYFLGSASSSPKSIRLEPDLRYSGPEMSEGGAGGDGATIRHAAQSADVFSLGLVAFEMYRYCILLAQQGRAHAPVIQLHNNSLADHPLAVQAVQSVDYSPVPLAARQLLTGMMQDNMQARISLLDLSNNPFFHSGEMAILNTIDELLGKDVGSQASILASLNSQISSFSPRIIENTILPIICHVGVTNPSMWVYTLPVHTFIASKLTTNAFLRIATPSFIKGLAVSDFTETIHAFVKHMSLLLDKFDAQFFVTHVVPMLCNGIDRQVSNTLQVATIAVLVDDRVMRYLDQTVFLEEIIPRVCREACKNADSEVKLRGLYLLKVTVDRFDRTFATKNILPSLKHILGSNPAPYVTIAVVGVYDAMLKHITVETMSTAVLPVLMPVLADRTLTRDQFELLVNRILHIQQLVLSARTSEYSMPDIRVSSGDAPKGYFFKEESDNAKGIVTSSGVLMPSSAPPPVPAAPPSSSSSSASSSGYISSAPPPMPAKPPPVPSAAPPPVPPKPPPAAPSASFSTSPPTPSSPPPVPAVPSTLPPAAPSTGNSSGIGSSMASFFSSSKPAMSTSSTASSTAQSSVYTPPSIPAAHTSPPPQEADSFDVDDFMSSFSKPTAPTTFSTLPAAARAPYSDSRPATAAKSASSDWPSTSPPQSSSSSAPLDLFGNLTLSSNSAGAGGGISATSLQSQIEQTQAEIAKLSGQFSSQQQQYGSQQQQYGGQQQQQQYGGQQQQYGGQQQQYGGQQQRYGGQQPQGFGGTGFPTPPQQQQQGYGVMGGYQPHQQPQQLYDHQLGGSGMGNQPPQQSQYGMNTFAPSGGGFMTNQGSVGSSGAGYRPPAIPVIPRPPGATQSSSTQQSNDSFNLLDF